MLKKNWMRQRRAIIRTNRSRTWYIRWWAARAITRLRSTSTTSRTKRRCKESDSWKNRATKPFKNTTNWPLGRIRTRSRRKKRTTNCRRQSTTTSRLYWFLCILYQRTTRSTMSRNCSRCNVIWINHSATTRCHWSTRSVCRSCIRSSKLTLKTAKPCTEKHRCLRT